MKVRDLSIAKKYRDTVKRWGQPDITRKRVIIAPLMSEAPERDVDLQPALPQNNGDDDSQRASRYAQDIDTLFKQIKIEGEEEDENKIQTLSQDYLEYKIWMEKERNVRKDLNSIGLNTNWLLSKDERTALEDRVLQRLLPKEEKSFYEEDGLQEEETHKSLTPLPLSKAQERLLPLLQQPLPAALSIISEYCRKNKLRLVDLYAQIDKDKDWRLSRAELRKLVRQNGIPLTDAQLEEMIIALDMNDNDQLEYRELAQGVEAFRIDSRWQKVKELMEVLAAHKSANEVKSPTKDKTARDYIHNLRTESARVTDEDSDYEGDSFLALLQLPEMDQNDYSDSVASKAREIRLKKHQDRKKRAKQKQKPMKSVTFLPSTIKGITGERKDRYAERTVNHVNDSLDLMHTNGIPVKENAVKRVLLFPFDRPVQDCISSIRQPGLNLMSLSDLKKWRGMNENANDSDYSRGDRRRRRKRRSKREQNPFWPDSTSPLLSFEENGRHTPLESIFSVIKTP